MHITLSGAAWEVMYAPYDQATYQTVLDHLRPDDLLLDIGAGDLRLARQMARLVRKVYAVEISPRVLDQANITRDPLPANLLPVCADAQTLDFPSDITAGVLMMRHCTCFCVYADKQKKAGASRLTTNARWRMGVEAVDLQAGRKSYADSEMGWYACICGAVGFKEGPAEHWSIDMDQITNEVSSCPQCMEISKKYYVILKEPLGGM